VGAAEALGGASQDHLGRTGSILPHIAVPDAKYGPSLFSQPLVPQQVTLGFCMLTAIGFDAPGHKMTVAERALRTHPWPLPSWEGKANNPC
jgi:hypothetical protein